MLTGVLVALVAALVPGTPTATAASGSALTAQRSGTLAGVPTALPVAARGGRRSFGGSRARSRSRSVRAPRRPFNGRRFASSVLRALGIAYLFHLLFGIGSGGGSPIPLLLILGFVAFMVVRSRQRRRAYAAY